ncbi:TonB-dependent receptor [Novosphingobium kaempferiae]|uniref:TonB-dependent receptor n=1 Tax=Novosphingobium kaempferiae TaxID=2896849 RepID=UPI001E52EBBF|nr:TonB-dependent receptor [Novosphingobium kaempferiae]
MGAPACAEEDRQEYHLPAQDLGTALRAVGRTSNREIMFQVETVEGKQSPALDGTYSPDEAIAILLRGSGLMVSQRGATILIQTGFPPAPAQASDAQDTILVTGTRIRGAPSTSPITTISREDAESRGQIDLGQIVRDLPQNFAGGQNPTIAGPGQGGTQNTTGSSAINLRGLGPDASLTLVNGHRLAFDAVYQGVDISAIPLAAIERVDVTADGASALYGSDAVGGVANVILRRRVKGVITSATLGAATAGGAVTRQFDLVAGPSWSSGSFMAAANYRQVSEIVGRHRSYTSRLSPDGTLVAGQKQFSIVVAGYQNLTDRLTLEMDGNYLHRSLPQCLTVTVVAPNSCYENGSVVSSVVDSWSFSPTLRLDLGSDWLARLAGTYSRSKTSITTRNIVGAEETAVYRPNYDNDLKSVELGLEGPLFHLPGGEARLAVGAGYRGSRLDYDVRSYVNGAESPIGVFKQTSNVGFAYGELFLPFVSPQTSLPLINTLQFVGAIRFEDHEGIDRVTTPKIGLVYSPTQGIEIKANWGKSFKAPTLFQLGQASNAQLVTAAMYTPAPPSSLPVLYLFGGNPNLAPERATTWNISGAVAPALLEGLKAEVSYFKIKYRGRVAEPLLNSLQAFRPVYADYVQLNPSADEVLSAIEGVTGVFQNLTDGEFDPGAVSAIVRDNLQNVSLQSSRGVDVAVSYDHHFAQNSRLSVKGSASYIDSKRKVTATLPVVPQSGVIFTPPHWRARMTASWERDNVTATVIGNYVGGTTDNRYNPTVRVGSFTTLDAAASIRSVAQRGMLANLQWRVVVQNLLDAKPAVIRTSLPSLPPFDSLNQSMLGRVVTITLMKAW